MVANFLVVANLLDANQSQYVKETVQKCPKWKDFKSGLLTESNSNNNQPLAGHQASHFDDDEDSDDNHYETSMDKLF